MAFFSNGSDKEKLMLLYSLKTAGVPLSREQLTAVVSECGLDNFITVSEHVMELENSGFVATVPMHRRETVALTGRGEETLGLFALTLPRSVREKLSEVVAENAESFRRENTTQTETRAATDGFVTTLSLVDRGEAFFELSIRLPDAKYTRVAERRWNEIGGKLYLDTLLALTHEEKEKDASQDAEEQQ